MEIINIPISQIDHPQTLVRPIDGATVSDLRDSIKEVGLLQPILVQKLGSRYEIICGNHRFLACKGAEMKCVPCIITDLSPSETILISIIENIQRLSINPVREGELFLKTGYSPKLLSTKLGKSIPYIETRISIYNNLNDELKPRIGETLTINNAISLSKLPKPHQLDVYKVMITNRNSIGLPQGTNLGGTGPHPPNPETVGIYCRCIKCGGTHLRGVNIDRKNK